MWLLPAPWFFLLVQNTHLSLIVLLQNCCKIPNALHDNNLPLHMWCGFVKICLIPCYSIKSHSFQTCTAAHSLSITYDKNSRMTNSGNAEVLRKTAMPRRKRRTQVTRPPGSTGSPACCSSAPTLLFTGCVSLGDFTSRISSYSKK